MLLYCLKRKGFLKIQTEEVERFAYAPNYLQIKLFLEYFSKHSKYNQ